MPPAPGLQRGLPGQGLAPWRHTYQQALIDGGASRRAPASRDDTLTNGPIKGETSRAPLGLSRRVPGGGGEFGRCQSIHPAFPNDRDVALLPA